MKKETFIKKVQKELDNIKKKATPEEIKNLKVKNFNPSSGFGCIYGLLTGVWNSDRAKKIQKKTFSNLQGYPNNSFVNQSFNQTNCGVGYTALEKYILMVDKKKNNEIIKYLKGKIETIDLNVI